MRFRTDAAPSPSTYRQRLASLVEERRGTLRLNASFIAGGIVSTVALYGTAQLAEKAGIDRTSATTWVGGLSGYILGTAATCLVWARLHRQEYRENPGQLKTHLWNLVFGGAVAQLGAWVGGWSAAALAVLHGASNLAATAINQAVGILVYVPIFNRLNRQTIQDVDRGTD